MSIGLSLSLLADGDGWGFNCFIKGAKLMMLSSFSRRFGWDDLDLGVSIDNEYDSADLDDDGDVEEGTWFRNNSLRRFFLGRFDDSVVYKN